MIITVRDTVPPVADAGGDFETVTGKKVAFDGSGSSDEMGIVDFIWNFSYDGALQSLEGMVVEFTFDRPGEYNITLTVTDGGGNQASDNIIVVVTERDPDNGAKTESSGSGLVIAIVLIVVILLFAGVACVVVLLKRRKREEPKEQDGGVTETTTAGEIQEPGLVQVTPSPLPPLEAISPDTGEQAVQTGYQAPQVDELPSTLDEGTGTSQIPLCPKCGQPSEFYPEYDCYWCNPCQDYVFAEGSASAEGMGAPGESTATGQEISGDAGNGTGNNVR